MSDYMPLPEIRFRPKEPKILEAVLFLIQECAQTRGHAPSQYDIVKTIFLADRAHLNNYGRPITFDNYVAMTHGPVPSFTYDLLKPTFDFGRVYGDPRPPWTVERVGNISRFVGVARSPNLRVLSKTDIDALRDALATIMSLSFSQVRKLTHQDAAYLDAWQGDGEAQSYPMRYALLLEEPEPDRIEDLAHIAEVA
jgi:uncharacterized phage-associated protein